MRHPRRLSDAVHQDDFADLLKRLERTEQRLDRLVGNLREGVDQIQETLTETVRLDVVSDVTALPGSAAPRQWFRVASGTAAERLAVYIGNGQGQPLTRLVPVTPAP